MRERNSTRHKGPTFWRVGWRVSSAFSRVESLLSSSQIYRYSNPEVIYAFHLSTSCHLSRLPDGTSPRLRRPDSSICRSLCFPREQHLNRLEVTLSRHHIEPHNHRIIACNIFRWLKSLLPVRPSNKRHVLHRVRLPAGHIHQARILHDRLGVVYLSYVTV